MMDEKKIEYLKKHLEQALLDDDYSGVNICYQELLKHINVGDIPELVQKVNEYNQKQSSKTSQKNSTSLQDIKLQIRSIKKKHRIFKKIGKIGIISSIVAPILGFLCLVCGLVCGEFVSYEIYTVLFDLAIYLFLCFFLIFVWLIFLALTLKTKALDQYRKELFKLICEGEGRLKGLENVEVTERYVGQVKNNAGNGFGVGFYFRNDTIGDGFYVGDYKDDLQSGIGRIITDDMFMTLEGEFKEGDANGVVDIQWEDGSEWHGVYKNGLPWKGQGKTIVKKKVQEGVWKNGLKIQ